MFCPDTRFPAGCKAELSWSPAITPLYIILLGYSKTIVATPSPSAELMHWIGVLCVHKFTNKHICES